MQELIQNLTFNTSLDHGLTYNFLGFMRPKTSDEQMQTSLRNLQRSIDSTISNPSIVQLDSNSLNEEQRNYAKKRQNVIKVDDLSKSQVNRMQELATVLSEQNSGATDFAIKALQQENKELKQKLEILQAKHDSASHEHLAASEGARTQLSQLRQQNDEVSQQLIDLQQEKLRLQLALKQAEREAHSAKTESEELRGKFTKQQEQIEIYAKQIENLQNQLSGAENAVQTMVKILEQHKIIPPPAVVNPATKKLIGAAANQMFSSRASSSGQMTGSVIRTTGTGQRSSESDNTLSATVVHSSPTMLRKCAACNAIDTSSPSSSIDGPNKNDRAAKVLIQLKQEKKDTEEDLQNLVADAYVNPEALYKNIGKVSKLINQNKTKKKEIRQLSMYKKQVDKLGVKMK